LHDDFVGDAGLLNDELVTAAADNFQRRLGDSLQQKPCVVSRNQTVLIPRQDQSGSLDAGQVLPRVVGLYGLPLLL